MELDDFFYDDISLGDVFSLPQAPTDEYQFQGWERLDSEGGVIIGTWVDPERVVQLSENQWNDIPEVAKVSLDEVLLEVVENNPWMELVTKEADRSADTFRDTPYMSPEDIYNSYKDTAAWPYLEIYYDEEDDSWYAIINY